MIENDLLQRPLRRAQTLGRTAERLSALEAAARMALRLGQAIAAGKGEGVSRPVTIALIGATGSGKSALFNALTEVPEGSTTATTRGHTRVPFVGGSAPDFSLLPGLRKIGARHVAADLEGMVVVDTPDLDSVERRNREVAREAIGAADVVVYVTIPDRVSDFAIQEEVRGWARQKRWFFVLNKIDLYEDSAAEVREGFDQRLRELGFTPDDRTRFLVSAIHPGHHDFAAFRRAVFSSRAAEKVKMLRSAAVLGMLEHALDHETVIAPLRAKLEKFQLREAELEARLRRLYRSALDADSSREAVRILVRSRTWQNLAIRTGWIMGWIVWLKCRAALVSSAWQLGRMVTRGPTFFGLLWIALISVVSAVRGLLPLQTLRASLTGNFEREVREVERDAARALEDEGLGDRSIAADRAPDADGAGELHAAWVRAVRAVPAVGEETARALEKSARHRTVADELTGPLQEAIDQAAEAAARRSVGAFVKFFANLLPTAVLLHVAWRVGEAWYFGDWLPGGFYALAITIFLLSLIPGYLLLTVAVRARTRMPEMGTVVQGLTRPAPTAPLRAVREELENLLREAQALSHGIVTLRRMLESELPTESFGARADAKVERADVT